MMKRLSVVAVLTFTMISAVEANAIKLGVESIQEVAKYIKSGKAVSQVSTMNVVPFKAGVSGRRVLLSTVKTASKNDIHVTVLAREMHPFNVLEVSLIQKIDNFEAFELRHASQVDDRIPVGPRNAILRSDVHDAGEQMVRRLSSIDGVVSSRNSLQQIQEEVLRTRAPIAPITLDLRTALPEAILQAGNLGPSAGYTFRIGFSKQASVEQVSEVLEAIAAVL